MQFSTLVTIWSAVGFVESFIQFLYPDVWKAAQQVARIEEISVDETQSSYYLQCPSKVVRMVRQRKTRKLKDFLSENTSAVDCRTTFEARSSKGQVEGSLLHLAADLGKEDIIQVLLDHKFNPNALTTWRGGHWPNNSTALMFAACLGPNKASWVVNALLNKEGLDVNRQSEDGMTALMLASRQGNHEVLGELSRAEKLRVNLRNEDGMTAVMLAAESGQRYVIKFLTHTLRANINLERKDGQNALDLALRGRHEEVVMEILTSHHLLINQRSKEIGNAALERALLNGWDDRVLSLLARGVGERFEAERLQRVHEKIGPTFPLQHPDQDMSQILPLELIKGWNRLHWAAYLCDLQALAFLPDVLPDLIMPLYSERPELEGYNQTPWEIAASLAETSEYCLGVDVSFQNIQENIDNHAKGMLILGYLLFSGFPAVAIGAVVWNTLGVRMRALEGQGWTSLLAVPICLLHLESMLHKFDPLEPGLLPERMWKFSRALIRCTFTGFLLLALGILATYAGDRSVKRTRPDTGAARPPSPEPCSKFTVLATTVLVLIFFALMLLLALAGLGGRA